MVDLQEVIEDVRSVRHERGRITMKLYKKYGKYNVEHMLRKMDIRWNQFLTSYCHIAPSWQTHISDQQYLDDIKRVAGILGKTPSMQQYSKYGNYSADAISNRFNKWNIALDRAGLLVTKDRIVQDIREICPSSMTDYIEKTSLLQSSTKFYAIFSTWEEACLCANIKYTNRFHYTDEELLQYLRRKSEQLGRTVTKYDLDQPSDKTYFDRFGSFINALSLAGLDPSRHKLALDGHWYDSALEADVANILFTNFIDYEPHKRVCKDRKWTCDFYIPPQEGVPNELWVEYDGMGEWRDSFKNSTHVEKLHFYKSNNYNYVILIPTDDPITKLNLSIENSQLVLKECTLKDLLPLIMRLGIDKLDWRPSYPAYFLNNKIVGFIRNDNEEIMLERIDYGN